MGNGRREVAAFVLEVAGEEFQHRPAHPVQDIDAEGSAPVEKDLQRDEVRFAGPDTVAGEVSGSRELAGVVMRVLGTPMSVVCSMSSSTFLHRGWVTA